MLQVKKLTVKAQFNLPVWSFAANKKKLECNALKL